jgi:hypothetical protein
MTNPVLLKDDSHYIRSHRINFSPVPVVQDNECGKFFRLHFFRNVSFYKEPPIAAKLRVEWDRGGQRGRVGGVVWKNCRNLRFVLNPQAPQVHHRHSTDITAHHRPTTGTSFAWHHYRQYMTCLWRVYGACGVPVVPVGSSIAVNPRLCGKIFESQLY